MGSSDLVVVAGVVLSVLAGSNIAEGQSAGSWQLVHWKVNGCLDQSICKKHAPGIWDGTGLKAPYTATLESNLDNLTKHCKSCHFKAEAWSYREPRGLCENDQHILPYNSATLKGVKATKLRAIALGGDLGCDDIDLQFTTEKEKTADLCRLSSIDNKHQILHGQTFANGKPAMLILNETGMHHYGAVDLKGCENHQALDGVAVVYDLEFDGVGYWRLKPLILFFSVFFFLY